MVRPIYNMEASGRRMRQIRKQRKISVKQVTEYMGFESTQAVYKWEAGKCYPQADNLVALAVLYNVSPVELLVEEDVESSLNIDFKYTNRKEMLLQIREGLQNRIHSYFYKLSL